MEPQKFLPARWDECPESYCHTPGVSFGVHKNYNLGYYFWTIKDKDCKLHVYSFIFLWQDLSLDIKIFDRLTLKFDLLFKNFNLADNF